MTPFFFLDPSNQGTGMTRRVHCCHKGTSVSYSDDNKELLG
ncbi:hypothetical protein OZD68_04670 [Wolbachia endosymbiont of Drosophila bicornuta]|nr:hypothetical protein [Wolbachia pipientis]MDE5056863.1 hypothetical protein [Wolbachia endosymbiont of Drosophila bicornuta]